MRTVLRRLALAVGLAFVVLVGVLLAVLPGRGEERADSVFSTQPGGLRALYLLCEALGFAVEPWEDAPGALRGRGALLVLPALPEAPPDSPPDAPTERAPRRSRDLAHYRRFVEEGGTLLVLDVGPEELEDLRTTLALPGLDDLESAELALSGDAASEVHVGAERLALGAPLASALHARAPAEVLAQAADGAPLVLVRDVERGRVVLASIPLDGLENRALASAGDAALLFVRLLEALAPERVLFDEYALGGWRPRSAAALALSPQLAWLSAHALLLLVVLAWRSAWSGPFPHDPEALLAASPLARARGFARLLARAGRVDLLARLLRHGLLERWGGRAGAAPLDLEQSLRTLARGDERLRARLRDLFGRAPRDVRELAQLERDLRALEAELFPPAAAGKTRLTLGRRPSATGSFAP